MPSSRSKAAQVLVGCAMPFILSFGCNVLVGIEDKSPPEGGGTGAGGSSSSSNGVTSSSGSSSSGSSSSGSGSSSGGVDQCPAPWPKSMMCAGKDVCPGMAAQVTDACHCGGCFIDCGDGVQCAVGRCATRPLAVVPDRNIHITASNGARVFFAAFNEGNSTTDIHEMPLVGAPMTKIIATVAGSVEAMAADCENVYFSTVPDNGNGNNAVWHLSLMAGDPQMVPMPPDGFGGEFKTVAIDNSGNVYWTESKGVGIWHKGNGTSARVMGGDAGLKASGLAVYDNGGSQDVYWANFDGSSMGRILHVVVTNSNPGVPETMVAAGDIEARQLGVDAANVYWVDVALVPYRVMRVSRTMPFAKDQAYAPPPNMMAVKLGDTIAVDRDGLYLYVIQGVDGDPRTFRVPKGMMGGLPLPITMQTDGIREGWLTIGSGRLYLASSKNGPMGNEGLVHSITISSPKP